MRYRCGEGRCPAELPLRILLLVARESAQQLRKRQPPEHAIGELEHEALAPRMAPKAERVFDETRHRAPRALRTCACLEFALASVWYKEFLTQLVMERINLALFAVNCDERTM